MAINEYDYRNGLQQALAVPQSQRAVPRLSDILGAKGQSNMARDIADVSRQTTMQNAANSLKLEASGLAGARREGRLATGVATADIGMAEKYRREMMDKAYRDRLETQRMTAMQNAYIDAIYRNRDKILRYGEENPIEYSYSPQLTL